MGADTNANDGAAAHSSEATALPLSPSHNLVMPSAVKVPLPPRSRPQSWLPAKLPRGRRKCQWALTQKQTLRGGGALEVGDLRLIEDGSKRSGALGSDGVDSETVSEGKDGKR